MPRLSQNPPTVPAQLGEISLSRTGYDLVTNRSEVERIQCQLDALGSVLVPIIREKLGSSKKTGQLANQVETYLSNLEKGPVTAEDLVRLGGLLDRGRTPKLHARFIERVQLIADFVERVHAGYVTPDLTLNSRVDRQGASYDLLLKGLEQVLTFDRLYQKAAEQLGTRLRREITSSCVTRKDCSLTQHSENKIKSAHDMSGKDRVVEGTRLTHLAASQPSSLTGLGIEALKLVIVATVAVAALIALPFTTLKSWKRTPTEKCKDADPSSEQTPRKSSRLGGLFENLRELCSQLWSKFTEHSMKSVTTAFGPTIERSQNLANRKEHRQGKQEGIGTVVRGERMDQFTFHGEAVYVISDRKGTLIRLDKFLESSSQGGALSLYNHIYRSQALTLDSSITTMPCARHEIQFRVPVAPETRITFPLDYRLKVKSISFHNNEGVALLDGSTIVITECIYGGFSLEIPAQATKIIFCAERGGDVNNLRVATEWRFATELLPHHGFYFSMGDRAFLSALELIPSREQQIQYWCYRSDRLEFIYTKHPLVRDFYNSAGDAVTETISATRMGICSDFATLTAAQFAAIGLPAFVVLGPVIEGNSLSYNPSHAVAVVHSGHEIHQIDLTREAKLGKHVLRQDLLKEEISRTLSEVRVETPQVSELHRVATQIRKLLLLSHNEDSQKLGALSALQRFVLGVRDPVQSRPQGDKAYRKIEPTGSRDFDEGYGAVSLYAFRLALTDFRDNKSTPEQLRSVLDFLEDKNSLPDNALSVARRQHDIADWPAEEFIVLNGYDPVYDAAKILSQSVVRSDVTDADKKRITKLLLSYVIPEHLHGPFDECSYTPFSSFPLSKLSEIFTTQFLDTLPNSSLELLIEGYVSHICATPTFSLKQVEETGEWGLSTQFSTRVPSSEFEQWADQLGSLLMYAQKRNVSLARDTADSTAARLIQIAAALDINFSITGQSNSSESIDRAGTVQKFLSSYEAICRLSGRQPVEVGIAIIKRYGLPCAFAFGHLREEAGYSLGTSGSISEEVVKLLNRDTKLQTDWSELLVSLSAALGTDLSLREYTEELEQGIGAVLKKHILSRGFFPTFNFPSRENGGSRLSALLEADSEAQIGRTLIALSYWGLNPMLEGIRAAWPRNFSEADRINSILRQAEFELSSSSKYVSLSDNEENLGKHLRLMAPLNNTLHRIARATLEIDSGVPVLEGFEQVEFIINPVRDTLEQLYEQNHRWNVSSYGNGCVDSYELLLDSLFYDIQDSERYYALLWVYGGTRTQGEGENILPLDAELLRELASAFRCSDDQLCASLLAKLEIGCNSSPQLEAASSPRAKTAVVLSAALLSTGSRPGLPTEIPESTRNPSSMLLNEWELRVANTITFFSEVVSAPKKIGQGVGVENIWDCIKTNSESSLDYNDIYGVWQQVERVLPFAQKEFRSLYARAVHDLSRQTSLKHHQGDFHSYRDYQSGDDVRSVDWKLYGRSDRLYVREKWNEVKHPVDYIVDVEKLFVREGYDGSRQSEIDQKELLHLFCSLYSAIRDGLEVKVVINFRGSVRAILEPRALGELHSEAFNTPLHEALSVCAGILDEEAVCIDENPPLAYSLGSSFLISSLKPSVCIIHATEKNYSVSTDFFTMLQRVGHHLSLLSSDLINSKRV